MPPPVPLKNKNHRQKLAAEFTPLRLNLDTSFTGKDNLRVRLAAANAVTPNIGAAEGHLAFADDESGGNDLAIDALVYAFPLTEKLDVAIAAYAGASDDFASTINWLDGDGNEGALTQFGTRNPIITRLNQFVCLIC